MDEDVRHTVVEHTAGRHAMAVIPRSGSAGGRTICPQPRWYEDDAERDPDQHDAMPRHPAGQADVDGLQTPGRLMTTTAAR
jgi:hypothetical protein